MALEVVDRAMQSYGAEGLSQDQELASMWAELRTLRVADVRRSDLKADQSSFCFVRYFF